MALHWMAVGQGAQRVSDGAHDFASEDGWPLDLQPADTIRGGSEGTLTGTDGDDVIHVSAPDHAANGMGGADRIDYSGSSVTFLAGYTWTSMGAGVDGSDTIHGGSGQDYIVGGAGSDTLYGGAGDDSVYGALTSSTEQASDGADFINLGAGNDYTKGNDGADTLLGGSGSDTLNGQWGNDWLDGGSGVDLATYAFAGATTGISFDGSSFLEGAATQTLADGLGGVDTLTAMEALSIVGTAYDDVLTGSSADDVIAGAGGADRVDGGDGDDLLTATGGDATLLGGEGADTLKATASGPSHEVLQGGAGVNLVSVDWSSAGSAVTLRLTGSGFLSGSSADGDLTVEGAGFAAATLVGGAGSDTLSGAKGDDVVAGGYGDDVLRGGGGHDVYYVDEGGEPWTGFSLDASDLSAKGADAVVTGNTTGVDHLTGFEAVEIIGSNYSDTIVGSAGADTLTDGARPDQLGYDNGQQDSISGGDGNDAIYYSVESTEDRLSGGSGVDTLYCSATVTAVVDLVAGTASGLGSSSTSFISGFEHVVGGSAADSLLGSDAKETLEGGAGADTIAGGGGKDLIDGGTGADLLSGGGNADIFRFSSADDSTSLAQDRIVGLTNNDWIYLGAVDADAGAKGDQAFHLVDQFSGHAGELALVYDQATGQTLLLGDVDADGVADLSVAIAGDHRDFTNFQL